VASRDPLGVIPWHGLPAQGCPAAWRFFSARPEQSRGGERREREGGRKGLGFKLNFLKLSNRNLKNFEHESCREFKNLQLLF
jgi:hypothetical protein